MKPTASPSKLTRHRMTTPVTALLVGGGLVATKELSDCPKPLVVALAIVFVACCLGCGILLKRRELSSLAYASRLLVTWCVASVGLCATVYQVDRGGWNWYRLSGFNDAIAERRVIDTRLSPAEFVARNPSFCLDAADPGRIVLRQGNYSFYRTIVVPAGSLLTIEPGTLVRMRVGCSLISYSPIVARGTQRNPIRFTALQRWFKWGVIGVVDARHSVFQHVHLEHARQAVVNGIDFPGGLSLIRSDVEITNCDFIHMFGKDAVHVCQAHVLMKNNRVQLAFKDGVDLDGATGTIQGNLFVDCDDESIDLSGDFPVNVSQNTIRDRRGGRIAADHNLDQILLANTLEYSSGVNP